MKNLLVVAATCVMATLMSELTITGTNSKDRLPFPIQKPSGVTQTLGAHVFRHFPFLPQLLILI